jgi:hypothetical protein
MPPQRFERLINNYRKCLVAESLKVAHAGRQAVKCQGEMTFSQGNRVLNNFEFTHNKKCLYFK